MVAELLMLKQVVETKRKAIFILPFVSVVREKMLNLQVGVLKYFINLVNVLSIKFFILVGFRLQSFMVIFVKLVSTLAVKTSSITRAHTVLHTRSQVLVPPSVCMCTSLWIKKTWLSRSQ